MGLDIVQDENCHPSLGPIESKKEVLHTKRAKVPLKDSTNLGVPSVEIKTKQQSACGEVEGHSELIGEKRALPSSEASHEAVQLDSEGFVIWEDSQPQEIHVDLAEEIRTLKAALTEALEENKFLHAKLACEECDQEELKSLRNELENIYTLYAMTKQELDELRSLE